MRPRVKSVTTQRSEGTLFVIIRCETIVLDITIPLNNTTAFPLNLFLKNIYFVPRAERVGLQARYIFKARDVSRELE